KVELEEAHQHSDTDAIARVDGYVVTVKDAAGRVVETVPIRIESVAKTTARAVIAERESTNGDDPAKEKPKKKTRRGSRGGRGRKKKTETTAEASAETIGEVGAAAEPSGEAAEPAAEAPSENGEEPKPKKKTRRGTRGGRGRKRKPVESSPEAGQESPLV
ncbi:MAG TPA: TRAM domain-containing protein, partial [Polyangiaceae bacterium]|nr:TRAM domain-containing protein [Polyangiaceae bacterium]